MPSQYEDKLTKIRKRIDSDTGLKRIGKQITYISLVCLAIALTGATVEKANTFIFEFTFASPKGLSVLLVLSLCFLLVRYHGFAYSYFQDLKIISIERFEQHPLITDTRDPSGMLHGAIGEVAENIPGEQPADIIFKWKWPLKMYLEIYYVDTNGFESMDRESFDDGHFKKTTKEKLKIAWCLIATKLKNFTNHQDHLNLLTPYFIGVIAIATMLTNFIKPTLITGLINQMH